LLAVYSLGLGIPFLLAAVALEPFIGFLNRFRGHFPIIERIVGILLIATGIAFLTGTMQSFSYWLLQIFPGLAALG
jgi:cytochrome c-type biogenesis protein